MQLEVLFEKFNDMARAGFVAHARHSYIKNFLMILYGLDKGRCFVLALGHPKYNLVIIVLLWAAARDGYASDYSVYNPSCDLRIAYVYT
jgi:hypothetical protein